MVESKVNSIDKEKIQEIGKTKGKCIVEDFYTHLNTISSVKLNNDFLSSDNYDFDILESDYRLEFYDRFKYLLFGNNKPDLSQIIEYDLNRAISNSNFLDFEYNNKTSQKMIIIDWKGLKNFIGADYGLKINMEQETFYKTLQLPSTIEFKPAKVNNIQKRNIMKVTIREFYKYFLNSNAKDSEVLDDY